MIGSLALSAAMADDLPATPQEADILHPTPERRRELVADAAHVAFDAAVRRAWRKRDAAIRAAHDDFAADIREAREARDRWVDRG